MNEFLRRGGVVALVVGSLALYGCSSDTGESTNDGMMGMDSLPSASEAANAGNPVNQYAAAGNAGMSAVSDATNSGGNSSSTSMGGGSSMGVNRPMASAMPTMGSQDSEFSRTQEERTLAEQRQQLLVDSYLVAARSHMKNGELDKAERAIIQALNASPSDQNSIEMLRQVRGLQGHSIDSMEEISVYLVNKRKLIRQSQQAQVNTSMAKAMQSYNSGDFETAKEELSRAELIMRFDPYQTDFGAAEQDIGQLLKEVDNRLAQARRAQDNSVREQAYERVREAEAKKAAKEVEKVRQMMIRAVESFLREDYENSEFLAKKVLLVEPNFTKAKELVENSINARRAQWRADYGARRKEEYQKWIENVREVQVPYTSLLSWSSRERWEEITRLRRPNAAVDLALTESDAVKNIKAKLENDTIDFDYGEEEATLADVIKTVRSTKGFNIVMDAEVAADKGEAPVSVTLINQNLGSALRTVLNDHELAYTFKNDVMFITSKDKAMGRPVPEVYEVRDLTVSLPHFKAPNLTLRPGPAGEQAKGAIWGEELDRTTDTTLDALIDLIRENVRREAWDIEGFQLAASSGQVVVVATPDIHAEVSNFLNDLRRFTRLTVHVESRFISLQRGFLSDVGIDFRGLGGQNPGTVALLDDVTNGGVNQASAGIDNGQPSLPAAASLSPSSGLFYNDGSDGDVRARTENIFTRALGGFLSNSGGASVAFSILDDLQVGGLLRAVEKNANTTLVNAPRLTIFNNQRANLTLVNQVSYVKDYDVEVAQTAFIADPLVDIIQDGLTLDVRPTVSHDRKYVTLEVQPTVATLIRPIRTFETNLSGLTTPVVIELPEINYSQAATTVKVPDNGYVVIGGLKHVTTVDRRSETPILSNIPLLSFLFSRKGRSDEIRDLIIVLHVRILDLTEQEAELVN